MEKQTNSSSQSRNSASKGLVQIYTGDGKGKTTSAVGNIIRALSHNFKVYVAVFLKSQSREGEWSYLAGLPNVTIERFGSDNFCYPNNIQPDDRKQAADALNAARKAIMHGNYDLAVLDEVNVAAAMKLIDINDVIKLIEQKPERLNLILTGRNADPEIVKRADLVTEMLKIKHHFDAGVPAQQGIEF